MPLAKMYDEISRSLQDNQIVCGIFLDLKKAFDTVSIEILLQKLHFIGIRGDLHHIIKSYLDNRYQITKVNNICSDRKPVQIGVRHGSILGPLLFILYINDITYVTNEANFYLFADDTAITIKAKTHAELQIRINKILSDVSEWFLANRLSLNTSKTMYQLYSRSTLDDLDVQIHGSKILRQKSLRYLGVIVDENLKWKNHIYNISSIINRNLGV